MRYLLFGYYTNYPISTREGYLGRYDTVEQAKREAEGDRGRDGGFTGFNIFDVITGEWDGFGAPRVCESCARVLRGGDA